MALWQELRRDVRAAKERDGSMRKPTMYDMAGGGHWEAMSDHSVSVYRENLDTPVVTISVEKAKFWGSGMRKEAVVLYQRAIEYFVLADSKELAALGFTNADCQGLIPNSERGAAGPDMPADEVNFG